MSRLGQVSLTKPTYRRIVLRCCSVPQVKPSPDYEYRISLRPHPVGHPSSSTRDSASRAVPSSIRVRRDGYREAGEWQQAGGDQRDRAAQKVFARAGSRKPRSDQHQECSTTDNHGYRRLTCRPSTSPTTRVDGLGWRTGWGHGREIVGCASRGVPRLRRVVDSCFAPAHHAASKVDCSLT